MKLRSNHYFGLACATLFGFGLMAHVYGNIVLDGDFEAAAPTALSDTTTDFTLGNSIDGGHWTVGQGIVGVDMQNVFVYRSEEHTSELQALRHLVCRVLLEKKREA